MERIHVYSTNDIHSHLSKWPRIAAFLDEERKRVESNGDTFFAFDIGDACDRVHPLVEATNGTAMIDLMNQAHYDAATIGNNEGIGSSKEQLNELYEKAEFTPIISNMFDRYTGESPYHTKPFQVIRTKSGRRIGLFGLTASFPTSYVPLGWQIKDPYEVIPEMLEILEPLTDSVILLSHLGIGEDRKIGSLFPMIDLVLGSHTHHLLPEGEKVRETLLTGAGRYGEYISHVVLELGENGLENAAASVIPHEDLAPVKAEQQMVEGYLTEGHQLLSEQPIADIPETMPANWKADSKLAQISLEAIKYYAKTDAAVLNAGLFMQPLKKGIVSKDELHQMLPHPMRILRVKLTGEELTHVLEEMEKNRDFLREFPVKGMGFRGKVFGEILYNGMDYNRSTGQVLWQGEPVQADKEYTFATVDHIMYVPFFPTIELRGENELIFPLFIRGVVGQYLKKIYPIK